MPEEENKKLRDLVTETLQTKGVLGRIQAEIRASVFLALEEQDVFKDKPPFLNRQLKDFLKTSDGVAVISLVREFLEFFNLEFASMVFDPETHAGLDYNYEGRAKVASMLNINDTDKSKPLLGNFLKMHKFTHNIQINKEELNDAVLNINSRTSEINEMSNMKSSLNSDEIIGIPHCSVTKTVRDKINSKNLSEDSSLDLNNKLDEKPQEKSKELLGGASLTSLSNLPPIGKAPQLDVKDKKESYDLKALLDLSSEKHYDDDFLSSDSENLKKESKVNTISEGSEVEEEISGISNLSAQPDDNTTDISVSRPSAHGDYLESL